MFLIIGTLVIVLLALIYKWSVAKYNTFSDRNIPHETPRPWIGNLTFGEFFGSVPTLQKLINEHQQYKGSKIYGLYLLRDPIFVVRDVEMIKNVGVKEFDHFMNHMTIKEIETPFTKSLVQLTDRKWKEMRNILTPTFTGSKMRAMYDLINVCGEEGVKYIEGEIKLKGGNSIELEMKEYFTRFTNDVIASAAFGIKVNSFEDKDNQFFKLGQTITQITTFAIVKSMLFMMIPKIMKALGVSIMDDKKINYFKSLVFDAMKYRVDHKIIRPDMIHLLMEAQRKSDDDTEGGKKFSDEDLLAQCLLFFFAGFETVSVCLCFLTYELCMNPEVQSKLYEEISSVEEELDGKPLDYDTLVHMKYLDMVVSEALRKWPPAPRTDRFCNADIELRDEIDDTVVSLKKGDVLFIPIIGLHYDPENFTDPYEFRPERFSDENKHEIKPFTYLPFGVGPRNCIGNRMALMEVKSIVYHLILKFKLLPAEKTVKDMMSNIKGITLVPKDKFWIKYETRKTDVK